MLTEVEKVQILREVIVEDAAAKAHNSIGFDVELFGFFEKQKEVMEFLEESGYICTQITHETEPCFTVSFASTKEQLAERESWR